MKDSLDSEAVRRAVLRNGGRIRATAIELGMTHPNVTYHLKRANERSPLTWGTGSIEDREAMAAFWDATLTHAHINHAPARIRP